VADPLSALKRKRESGREFDALLEQLHVLPEFVAACGFQSRIGVVAAPHA
jgi:hypothetical protein